MIRIRKELLRKKEESTFDDLEEEYGVNRYYLWCIMDSDNYIPQSAEVRRKLGLIRPRPRRVAIRCDNMTSAAATITNNLAPEQVRELIERLKGDT